MHGLIDASVVVEALEARALSVPLREPFVIATGRVDATRAVEVEVRIVCRGVRAVGLGEAACLPPVTREDQPDVLWADERAAHEVAHGSSAEALLTPLGPVARAGLETALLDALARAQGVPLRVLLGGRPGPARLESDVTVAIAEPAKMAELAASWARAGFRALKVKVGKDLDQDARALLAIARAAPSARLRIDANAGYRAEEAIALARSCERLGIPVECWEQPCAADDLAGMARVAEALEAPVIADESVKTLADVRHLVAHRWADGINLKLAKTGSLEECVRMGREASAAGLRRMVGGMVETRLGMTAAAHVACAAGGVDYVDLDTAWLLADDPYVGGYRAEGPLYELPEEPGHGVTRRP